MKKDIKPLIDALEVPTDTISALVEVIKLLKPSGSEVAIHHNTFGGDKWEVWVDHRLWSSNELHKAINACINDSI